MPYSPLGIFKKLSSLWFIWNNFIKFAPNLTRDETLDKIGRFPFSITNNGTSIYVGFRAKVDDACVDVCVLVLGVLGIVKKIKS